MNKIYTVHIYGNDGECVEKNVIAKSCQAALIVVLQSTGEDQPLWQRPGWQVQVFEATQPIILR